jgi:hypothetical protein
VKTVLKEKRFQNVENVKKNVTAELNTVPLEAFADCFEKLFKPFNRYIQFDGALNIYETVLYFLIFLLIFFTSVMELYCQTFTYF